MDHQRVMKRTLAFLQLDGFGLELALLRFTEYTLDRVHIVGKVFARQQGPAMAARHIMHTTIFTRGIIEADPAREMGHGLCPGPVGIVLMPDHHAPVMGGFAEKLVMPEADRALQKLRSRNAKRWVPQQIVKPRSDAPGSQSMEQDLIGIGRFVGIELIKQFIAWIARIDQLVQLQAERLNLFVVQQLDARQVSILPVEPDLFVTQAIPGPLFDRGGLVKEVADQVVMSR